MSEISPVIRFRIRHDAYSDSEMAVRLMPTFETSGLLARRGVLFRQTRPDEYSLLSTRGLSCFAEDGDPTEWMLAAGVPDFLRTTQFAPDYIPSAVCRFELGAAGEVDVASAMKCVEGAKRWGSEFCRFTLRLSDAMIARAGTDGPLDFTLSFQPRYYRWEYLLVLRLKGGINPERLILREVSDKIVFSKPEPVEDKRLGPNAYRCVSEQSIAVRSRYDCHLELREVLDEAGRSRIVSRSVDCPEFGRYPASAGDRICQICFI